jgi:hypothetical protein
MFAKTIIDSDAFIDMPMSARLLYYDLGMRADDDGFVNSPKKIMRMIGSTDDDMKLLIAKKFIIPFESGIVVIKHWKIHNYIRKDTYKETNYKQEKATLALDENNSYKQVTGKPAPFHIDTVDEPSTQDRLGKDRLGKDRIGKYEGVPPELLEPLRDFKDMRKKIKAPLTDRALAMLLKKLNELSDGDMQKSIEILNQSTMNSWKGVYELKEDKPKESGNPFLDMLKKEALKEE